MPSGRIEASKNCSAKSAGEEVEGTPEPSSPARSPPGSLPHVTRFLGTSESYLAGVVRGMTFASLDPRRARRLRSESQHACTRGGSGAAAGYGGRPVSASLALGSCSGSTALSGAGRPGTTRATIEA
jgi:hypothetical protein